MTERCTKNLNTSDLVPETKSIRKSVKKKLKCELEPDMLSLLPVKKNNNSVKIFIDLFEMVHKII